MLVFNPCKTLLLLPPQITSTNSKSHLHHHHRHYHVSLRFPSKVHFKSTHFSPLSAVKSTQFSPLSAAAAAAAPPAAAAAPPPPPPPYSSFVVDLLMESCGFSFGKARLIIKQVPTVLKDGAKRPRSVITYFEATGFSKTQISKMVSKCPRLLVSNVEKTLRPKINFFQNLDISYLDLISKMPLILLLSLQNNIKPAHDLFKSYFDTDKYLVQVLERSHFSLLNTNGRKKIQTNINVLQQHGVPHSEIVHLFMKRPGSLAVKPKVFKRIVKRIVVLGFKPETRKFTLAVSVMASMKKATWDSKVDLLKSLGWSDEQILYSFRKNPYFLTGSGSKMKEIIEFFKESFNLDASFISTHSMILTYSFQGRVNPRSVVFKILRSKELIKGDNQLGYMMNQSETDFLSNYVFKYQVQLPYLYEVYKKELMLPECEEEDNDDITVSWGRDEDEDEDEEDKSV